MLGGILKEARERQGLTIEDMEKETSIRRAYIAAIEEENWDALPSPVYVKGFIRNLSNFLNIDSLPLIEEFIDILNGASGAPREEKPKEQENKSAETKKEETKKEPVGVSLKTQTVKKQKKSGFLLTAFLIVALVGAGAFYFMNKDGNPVPAKSDTTASEEKKEDAPKDKTVTEPAKPMPTKVTESLAKNEENKEQTQPQNQSQPQEQMQQSAQTPAGVDILAKIDGDCWLLVIVDGEKVFEGIASDGSNLTWKGKENISIRTGNAGAIGIVHNGKDLGPMGERGQVAEKVYAK